MIIAGIDVTTIEGAKEFNEKYKGEFKVTRDEKGGVTLEGIGEEQRTIFYDTDKNMFYVEE